jgi:peptide/nickel transport system permease protein
MIDDTALAAGESVAAQPAAPGAAQPRRRQRSFGAQARASLLRARWPLIAIAFLVLLVLCALFAGVLAPADPNRQNLILRLQPPMTDVQIEGEPFRFVLGSDGLGRDVLSRVIYGSRVSLLVGLAAVLLGGITGVLFGVLGGYFGGFLDDVVMRLADVQLAFPFILLAIMVLVILGPGLVNLVIVLAIGQWVVYARIARGETISQKRRDYVDSARAVGVQNGRILSRAILPNILAPLVVIASFNVAAVILSEAALSFLGLGVPPEVPTWGGMLAESRDQLLGGYWWLAVFPGVAIMLTVLSLNILGDWLRDFLDPRLRGR